MTPKQSIVLWPCYSRYEKNVCTQTKYSSWVWKYSCYIIKTTAQTKYSRHRWRNGGGGASGPSTFQTGGHGPSTFLTILFSSKRHPSRHAVRCLTWWKIVHQIASLKTTFSKKAPTSEGATPASRKRDARTGANAPVLITIFLLQNFAPPPLKIVPPPMTPGSWSFFSADLSTPRSWPHAK